MIETSTCQFGNPSDTSGYEANVPVEVLAVNRRGILGDIYFVKAKDSAYYGTALKKSGINPRIAQSIQGDYYCTSAIGLVRGKELTIEQAAQIFGFKLETVEA